RYYCPFFLAHILPFLIVLRSWCGAVAGSSSSVSAASTSYPSAAATSGAAPVTRPSPATGAIASSTPVISSSVAPCASAQVVLHSRQTPGDPIATSAPT